MYKIYAGDTVIYYPPRFSAGYLVVDPVVEMEPNTHGSMSFTMLSDHPCYDDIEALNTIIRVFDDTEEIFRGRVIEGTKDFYNQKEVYVEGELSFLVDSYYRPFGFQGSPADFFTALIENHNSQVDESRQFTVGEITVTNSNDYINCSSEEPLSTWDVITSRLIGTLGGIVRTRLENGVRYIDYIAAYTDISDQVIKFGENLLDIEDYVSAADIITCLIPYGAEFEEEDDGYTEQPENGSYNGNRVTIESVNGGVDYVESSVGVALYGRIWGTNTWDDVTEPANLLTKAQDYVDAGVVAATTLTIKAVDLHLIDVDTQRIRLGDSIRVYSRPHDLSTWLQCTKLKLHLANPEETEITLGASRSSFTSSVVSGTASGYSANYAQGASIVAQSVKAAVVECGYIYASLAEFDTLVAKAATFQTLKATVATIQDAYITTATVERLLADYATVENLDAATATITTLSSSVAEITALLSGTIGTGTLQAIYLTSENVVIDDAVITSAMIASITADKITSGTIYTSQVTIQTAEDDTSLKIADGTIQISDGTYVRVQIGEDASGDYNLYLWNADGDLIWNAQGLTAEGLGGNGAIIKDLNVADDAAISGSKLDIKSVASALNNDGSLVVDAAKVTINDTTLSAAYTSIITRFDGYDSSLSELESESVANIVTYYAIGASATESPGDPAETDVWTTEQLTAGEDEYLWVCYKQEMVDGSENWTTPFCITDSYARTKTATLQTSLEVVQGQISSLVSETTFTETIDALTGEITTLQNQYTSVTETIDGIETEIGDITTIVGDNYKALDARITTISETADGITATVSALSTTVNTVDSNYTTLSSQVSELEMTVSSISLSVTSSSSGTASIVLSVDGEDTGDAVEAVTSARTAFAAENTACTISAGTVTFNSNTFVVNSTYLTCTAAGAITATSGTIGAITLTSTGIYSSGTYTYTGEDDPSDIRSTKYVGWYRPTDMDDGDDTISFYAGASSTNATNIASAPFRVTYGGVMYATGAIISGEITATSGTIYDDINLGGALHVYDDSDLTTEGGYVGYLTGSTGSEETIGVGVIDATSTNYLIATDAGVRMSSDTADLYVSGSRVVATGDMTCKDGLTVTGATTLKSTLTVTDAVTLSSSLEVTDYAAFNGEVYFENSVTVDTLAVTDKISLGETLEGYECYIEGAAGSSAFLEAYLGYVYIQNDLYFGRGSTYGSINYLGQASLRRLTMNNASDGIRLTTNACIYSGIVSDSNYYPLFYTDSSYDYLHIGYNSGITAMFINCGGTIYLRPEGGYVAIQSNDTSSDWTAGNNFSLCFPTSSSTYGAYVYANSSGFNLGRSAFPTTIRSSGPTVTLTSNSNAQYLSVTYTDSACNAQVRVYSAKGGGCLYANADGFFGLYDFSFGTALIWHNTSGITYVSDTSYATYINGSSVSVTGTLEVHTADIYCGLSTSTMEQRIQVRNSYVRGYLYANTSGNLGIWNSTLSVNMIYQSSTGALYLANSTYATHLYGSSITANVSITTSSDRSLKTNIESLPDSYEAMLDAMEPVQFAMADDESGKLHMGYIANDVLAAVEDAGLAESDIAWIMRGDDDLLGLSYSEIIPLLHLKIKKLEARIAQLESA